MPVAAFDLLKEGGTVVTGRHGLAEQLRRRYDREQRAAGRLAWPAADVLPLEAWLRRHWEEAVVCGAGCGGLRLLTPEETRIAWRRVIEAGTAPGTDARILAPLAASAWRVCQHHGLDLAQLRATGDTDDTQAFCRWAAAYQQLLEDRGWLDPAALPARLARDISAGELSVPRRMAFAAVDPWTPALSVLAESLRGRGVQVESFWPEASGPDVQVAVCEDPDTELRQAAAWARARREADPRADIAVLVPDLARRWPQVRRAFLDHLAPGWQLHPPETLPVRLGGGRSLMDYPVVHAALALLRAGQGSLEFSEASYLLRCPHLPAAGREAYGRARAELELRRIVADRFSLASLARVAQPHAPEFAVLLGHLVEFPGSGRRMPPSQWSAAWSGLLQRCGWPGERFLDEEQVQVIAAFERALQAFAACDEATGNLGAGQALAELVALTAQRAFEPDAPEHAVAVLDYADAAGQTFDGLWVCGLEAGRWPAPPRPHPLLPLSLQRDAGLASATPALAFAEAEAQFKRFRRAASVVVFSWARASEETEALPSPLLNGMAAAAPIPELITHPDRSVVTASARLELGGTDALPTLASGHYLPGGARILSFQSSCPARAFIEARLRARELEAPRRPLDGAMRGTVVHRLLQCLYSREELRRGLGAIPAAELDRIVEPLARAVLEECLPGDDLFLVRLRDCERPRLQTLVRQLAELDAKRLPFTTSSEEPRELMLGPLLLRLRLDRVDRLAGGGELVMDYKTGQNPIGTWHGARLGDCQLPLYALTGDVRGVAVLQFKPGTLEVIGVSDEALGLGGMRTAGRYCREEGLRWDDLVLRWQHQLRALAEELAAGDFRVNPRKPELASGQFAALTRIHDELRLEDTEP